jgi:Transposase
MMDMKKSRFTEEQIIGFLKQAEAGMPVKELCRQGGQSRVPALKPSVSASALATRAALSSVYTMRKACWPHKTERGLLMARSNYPP